MTANKPEAGGLFPVDVTTITGVRIDGTEGVTPVDPGSAEVISAAGEVWLHWDHDGVRRSVNSRHIAEIYSKAPRVIDLTAPAKAEFSRLVAARAGSLG